MKSKTVVLGPLEYYEANVRLIAGVVIAAQSAPVEWNEAMISTIAAYNLVRNELGIEDPFGTEGRIAMQQILDVGKVAVSLRITDLVKIRWATKHKRGKYTLDPRFVVNYPTETWQITYKRNDTKYDQNHGSTGPVREQGPREPEVQSHTGGSPKEDSTFIG